MLELSGHVNCDVTLLLELEVLGLVMGAEIVGHDFVLLTEIVLLDDFVACEVVLGLAMAKQDGLTGSNGLSLSLEAVVGVKAVNDPLGVVGVASMHGSFLKAGLGREDHIALGSGAKIQNFSMQVLIGLNLNFLTETDNIVATENVLFFNTHQPVDVTSYWGVLDLAGVQTVRLINVVLLNAEVNNEVTSNELISKHN